MDANWSFPIKEGWILKDINNPLKTEVQADRRMKKWSYIEEVDKYLRGYFWKTERLCIMPSLIEVSRRKKDENPIFLRYGFSTN